MLVYVVTLTARMGSMEVCVNGRDFNAAKVIQAAPDGYENSALPGTLSVDKENGISVDLVVVVV